MKNLSVIPVCDFAKVFGLSETRSRRTINRFSKMIASVEVSDQRVLEIGAGNGFFSCMLRKLGAQSITSLEPESSGSSDSVVDRFSKSIDELQLDRISVLPCTFQDFESPHSSFDLIVSIASVNHLDERACEALQTSANARHEYLQLFRKMHSLLGPDGELVLADCGRRNLLGNMPRRLGLKHPFAPSIEWHKHQQPSVWADLISQAGFSSVTWEWMLPHRLKCSIDRLFDNAPMAYLTSSFFALRAAKSPDDKPGDLDRLRGGGHER